MATVEECSHMELYDIGPTDIELIGSRYILCLYLYNCVDRNIIKRVSISASNIVTFMQSNDIRYLSDLGNIHLPMRCLINRAGEINYVSLNGDEWVICKDLHVNKDRIYR